MNLPKIEAVAAIVLGIGFIAAGVLQRNRKRKLLADGTEAEGEVLDVLGDSSKTGSGQPVIRFTTGEKEVITEKYKISIPFSKKGQKVTLVYNAANPRQFIIKKIS